MSVQGREEIDIKTTVIETPIACAKMRELVGVVLRHMESHLETNEGLRLDKPLVEAIEALKKIRDDEMKASLGPPR